MVNLVLLEDIAILITASIALIYSGVLVVNSLVKIAYRFKVREYILTFVLLAFSTSIPELFVGITSALNKSPTLSLGNIVGANIMDVTIVIGVAALLARRFPFDKKLVRGTSIYAVALGALPMLLATIGSELSRIDGGILIIVFFVYMRKLISERKEHTEPFKSEQKKEMTGEDVIEGRVMWIKKIYLRLRDKLAFNIFIFIIGLSLVFLSADFVTKTAIDLAYQLNLPRLLVGMIIVAIGTTLPELTLEARIALSRRKEMALGDPLGSVVVNSTFILGLVALIYPVKVDSQFFFVGAMFMIAAASMLAIMLNVKKELTWKDGIWLLLAYVAFLIIQLNVKVFAEAL